MNTTHGKIIKYKRKTETKLSETENLEALETVINYYETPVLEQEEFDLKLQSLIDDKEVIEIVFWEATKYSKYEVTISNTK